MRRLTPAFLLMALLACSDESHSVIVDVRTDYVPGLEFATARAILDGEPERVIAATTREDFANGMRLAEYDGVLAGNHTLDVALVDTDGLVIVERRVLVQVVENIAMTVVLTRSCEGLSCPQTDPEATTCLGGVCVNPSCSEVDPTTCPATCGSDAECTVTAPCAVGRCVEGACLSAPDDTVCSTSEVCLPTTGCVPESGGTGVGFLRDVEITNVAAEPLPAGYTIRVGLGGAGTFSARPDLSDVRVIAPSTPLDGEGLQRVVDAEDALRAIFFNLVTEIGVGGSATYRLRYGDDSVAPPLEAPTDVFALFDDFDGPVLSTFWSVLGAPMVSGRLVLGTGDVAVASDPTRDGVDPESVFEARMAAAGASADGTYYWIGYQHMGDFGTGAPFQNWVGRPGIVFPWVNVSSAVQMCTDIATDDLPHRYRIERSRGTTRYFRDGAMACEVSVDDVVDYAIQLRNQSTTNVVEVDWVRVRNIVSPEPTVVVGPELRAP